MPGGTLRNWQSYGHKVSTITDAQRAILADPQTSGGLLVAVDEGSSGEFEAMASQNGLRLRPFGKLVPQGEVLVVVN